MRGGRQSGVTLVEMMVVAALIGLIAAVSFPSVTSGLDSIRLLSAADSITAFLNAGMERAERRMEGVEIGISTAENRLTLRSTNPTFARELHLPEGVTIARVHPPMMNGMEDPPLRTMYVYPGGVPPRVGVEIVNRRGARRIVRVDPITGISRVEAPPER